MSSSGLTRAYWGSVNKNKYLESPRMCKGVKCVKTICLFDIEESWCLFSIELQNPHKINTFSLRKLNPK